MGLLEVVWDVLGLNQASSDAVGDSLDQLLLGWFLVVVNSEDVLSLWLLVKDLEDDSGKVSHMNSWHKVVTLTDVWESDWFLEPGLLDVGVEDGLTLTVKDTS